MESVVSREELEELKKLMKKADEPKEKIKNYIQVAAADKQTYQDLKELYTLKYSQHINKDFYPYEELDGEYIIGKDPNGNELGLTEEQLNEHLLTVSMTGRGKTTLHYNLIETFLEQDLPFMIFDFKNDYRHLTKKHDNLLVINWKDLKFNPLKPPPGVNPEQWGEIVADIFSHATDLLIGSESYFLEKLKEIYDLYNVTGKPERYPSLFELKDLVQYDGVHPASPKFKYMERVHSRLTIMTGFPGQIFDCSSGYPIQDLLNRNVIIELKDPNQYATNFLIESILTWIYYYRDAMSQRGELRHVIMFDEAKRVFDVNKERQPESGWPPIDDIVGKVREYGESLIVADHEPSKLTDSLKANTNAKIWMALGSGKDIEEMKDIFGLDNDETDYTRTLEKGEALLKLADKDPVPINLPNYQLDKSVTEEEIRKEMKPEIEELNYRRRFRPQKFLDEISRSSEDEEVDIEISDPAKELLIDIKQNSLTGTTERYENLDFGKEKGNKAKEELIEEEYIREVEVSTGTRGRNPKLLEITKQGRKVLKELGHEVRREAKGGAEHRWWQKKIKEYYEGRGYDSFIEHYIGEKSIDVYSVNEDEEIATEVALSPDHEIENIKKCLEQEFDKVQVVYTSDRVKDKIEEQLREEFEDLPDEILFCRAKHFA